MYRPLPSYLTIKPSSVEGLGLFAVEPIKKSTSLGISHVYDKWFDNGYIRTPLGGFINHEPIVKEMQNKELVEVSGPNCTKEKSRPVGNKTEWNLITRRDIKAGEELTLHYTFYKPR